MFFWIFLFYFALFLVIFSGSFKEWKSKKGKILRIFFFPAIFGLFIAFLTVLKFYFIYKIALLVLVFITSVMSYRRYGDSLKRWLGQ